MRLIQSFPWFYSVFLVPIIIQSSSILISFSYSYYIYTLINTLFLFITPIKNILSFWYMLYTNWKQTKPSPTWPFQLWVVIEGNGKKMEGSLYHFKSNWWVINNMLGKFEHLNVRWEWLNEKKGVEAKDCDEFELMKMIVPLLIFVVEKSDTDRRNRVYWSHSLIFRRHSHYCTSIQTSLQFIIHINSSMSISTC